MLCQELHLVLLYERHLNALNHYKNYLSCSYNKKVSKCRFKVGYLVLNEKQKNQQPEKKRNFEPNWLGPFVITRTCESRAFKFSTFEGEPLDEPINGIYLRKFYA